MQFKAGRTKQFHWLWCGCMVCLLAGCVNAVEAERLTSQVTGKVTYNGEPLKMGNVKFQPPTGAFAMADINPDGTYSLNAIVGKNQVMIVSKEPEDPNGGDVPANRKIPKIFIPEKYGSPAAGIEFEVGPAENTANFDLKD